ASGYDIRLEVDGGVKASNIGEIAAAGPALATPKLGRRVLLPSKRAVTLSESSAISPTH
ncbi:hypothetical protein ACTXQV_72100, partial [Klebsiella pneumoniae]